jgi:uncharacterized SAM-binding protein YcdF (DUF218 family)
VRRRFRVLGWAVGWALLGGLSLWLVALGLVMLAGLRPEIRQADVILVLGAAQYNGRPSPVFRARLDHAIDLYHRGLASRLLVTGGVGVGDTLSEGEVGRRYAMRNGVPEGAILVERHGATSAESMRAAAALMRAHGRRTALVVSDPYHMLRIELLALRFGIRPYRAPTPGTPATRRWDTYWRFVVRESLIFPATSVVGAR